MAKDQFRLIAVAGDSDDHRDRAAQLFLQRVRAQPMFSRLFTLVPTYTTDLERAERYPDLYVPCLDDTTFEREVMPVAVFHRAEGKKLFGIKGPDISRDIGGRHVIITVGRDELQHQLWSGASYFSSRTVAVGVVFTDEVRTRRVRQLKDAGKTRVPRIYRPDALMLSVMAQCMANGHLRMVSMVDDVGGDLQQDLFSFTDALAKLELAGMDKSTTTMDIKALREDGDPSVPFEASKR